MGKYKDNCCINCSDEDRAKYEEIAKVIDSYKGKQGSLIMVLHAAQGIYGYLPLELQQFIADRMGIPFSEVYGVVSFYAFFTTKERGRHVVRVCLGTACYVKGAQKLIDSLTDKFQIEVGDVTADKKFTIEAARCIGACGLAPAMMVDDDVHKEVSPATLYDILDKYE